MLDNFTLKDNCTSHSWSDIKYFIRKVKPQLTKLRFVTLFLFDLIKLVVKINKDCNFAQFLSVLKIILVDFESVLVP